MDSALLPVAHCEEVPVPEFTGSPDIHDKIITEVSTTDDKKGETIDMEFRPTDVLLGKSILFNLVRYLHLPKQYAEPLASRLNEKSLLSHGTSVTYYRSREASFSKYFVGNGQLVYCKDIKGLLLEMGITYVPGDWRLFIDSSKRSMTSVLLHNGNVHGSIPTDHSVELKENHCSVKLVFDSLQYENHNWKICVDLKMVNFLLGQQSGYIKYPCFLCYWDSRAKQKHWCTAS